MANAVQQFQSNMNAAVGTMNTLLDQMPRLERMYAANSINVPMAATEPGLLLGCRGPVGTADLRRGGTQGR